MKIWDIVFTAPKDRPILVKFNNGIIQVCTWEDDGLGGAWFNASACLGNWEALEWAEIPKEDSQ